MPDCLKPWAKVTKPAFPDTTADEPGWVAVELKCVQPLAQPVTLTAIKATPALADIALLRMLGSPPWKVGALLLCASGNADYTLVNGRVVVRQGQITTVDMGPLIERHNQLAMQLALGVN